MKTEYAKQTLKSGSFISECPKGMKLKQMYDTEHLTTLQTDRSHWSTICSLKPSQIILEKYDN